MTRSFCADSRRAGRSPVVACGLAAISMLASAQAIACNAPQRPMQQIELMFGRSIAGHLRVGEAAWARFLAREITPRFPDGLTVLDTAGQWRAPARGPPGRATGDKGDTGPAGEATPPPREAAGRCGSKTLVPPPP